MTTEFFAQGRIVWGHPGKAQPVKDIRTKEQKIGRDGQPREQWVFGLAIPKDQFNATVWPEMYKEAQTAFPNQIPDKFAWKIKDGDGLDPQGKSYSDREGYAGCQVLTVSTEAFAPNMFKMDEHGSYRPISAEEIKCGDYVAVKIQCKYNGATGMDTPGLYINPDGIIHIGYGPEIVSSGADPEEMFAGFTPTLPAGASATPIMSTAPLPNQMGNVPPQQPPAQGVPGVPPQQPPAQQLPPPNHQFVQNATGQAPAQGVPGVPAGNGVNPAG